MQSVWGSGKITITYGAPRRELRLQRSRQPEELRQPLRMCAVGRPRMLRDAKPILWQGRYLVTG